MKIYRNITRIENLYVGGTFNDQGGKHSKIAEKLFHSLYIHSNYKFDHYNGGSYQQLEQILSSISQYHIIYWFADVPNDKLKLVRNIKTLNPASILVTSKRNVPEKYSLTDLVYCALGNKSNLLLEITRPGEKYQGRILDPLGNVFLDYTTDFTSVGRTLSQRVKELASYSRLGSKSIGELKEVPEEDKFFETIRHYGERFHELVHSHPQAANRFFGNASFRCERGFPSFRHDNLIYVSQRNIDKRFVDKESFVPVRLKLPLEYYGEKKPSVDTPIQVLLYQYFENVRYMLHGHVYVKNAPFTKEIIPCGALEEAEEIIKIFPSRQDNNFAINLNGHGSLVLVDEVEKLENIPYIARPQPETHENHFSGKLSNSWRNLK